MSPVGYPHAGYFDELGNLQYQQEEMNMKLNNVDGKLDILINGMMYSWVLLGTCGGLNVSTRMTVWTTQPFGRLAS
jgi:hypothetical protein